MLFVLRRTRVLKSSQIVDVLLASRKAFMKHAICPSHFRHYGSQTMFISNTLASEKEHDNKVVATWRQTLNELLSMGCTVDDILRDQHTDGPDKRINMYIPSDSTALPCFKMYKQKHNLHKKRLYKLRYSGKNSIEEDFNSITEYLDITSDDLLDRLIDGKRWASVSRIVPRLYLFKDYGFSTKQIKAALRTLTGPKYNIEHMKTRLDRLMVVSRVQAVELKCLDYDDSRFERYVEELRVSQLNRRKKPKLIEKAFTQHKREHEAHVDVKLRCKRLQNTGLSIEDILLYPDVLYLKNLNKLVKIIENNGMTINVPLLKLASADPRNFKENVAIYKTDLADKDAEYFSSLESVKQILGITSEQLLVLLLTKRGNTKRDLTIKHFIDALLDHGFTRQQLQANYMMLFRLQYTRGNLLAKVVFLRDCGFTTTDIINTCGILRFTLTHVKRAHKRLQSLDLTPITIQVLHKQARFDFGESVRSIELNWTDYDITTGRERHELLTGDLSTVQQNHQYLVQQGFTSDDIKTLPMILGHDFQVLKQNWEMLQEKDDPLWNMDNNKLLNILQYRIEFPNK